MYDDDVTLLSERAITALELFLKQGNFKGKVAKDVIRKLAMIAYHFESNLKNSNPKIRKSTSNLKASIRNVRKNDSTSFDIKMF